MEPPAEHEPASRSPGARRYAAYGVPCRNAATPSWKRAPRRIRTHNTPGKSRVFCH